MKTALFNRSCYSLLDSLLTPEKIVKLAKEKNYEAVGVCDLGFLGYAPSFIKACQNNNIKPLFLMEVNVRDEDNIYPYVLLAKDDYGFHNLIALSSYLNTKEKVIDFNLLAKYLDHNFLIIFSDNCPFASDGDFDFDKAKKYYEAKKSYDIIYALADLNYHSNRIALNNFYIFLKERGARLIAAHRCFYEKEKDYEALAVLNAIRDKKTIKDKDLVYHKGRYFLNIDEFEALYPKELYEETYKLADECNVTLAFKTSLPDFKAPQKVSNEEYLKALCIAGLNKRLKGHKNDLYNARLFHELKIIISMGFTNYFLIVYDYVCFAKKQGILVGPGRGSAVGSLVAYCIGITDIDPIRYGLIFERFLNPERITMPDIDIDFPDDKRDIVINYVKEKYGEQHIAHIITYGTLKARQVIRDVGRVLAYPAYEIDSITSLIPQDPKASLLKTYHSSLAFKHKIDSNERYHKLFELCLILENLPRHESTHAAGIVMSNKALQEVIPLIKIDDDIDTVQYTMEYLEDMGLIKMDFLGLRNLSIIDEIIKDIKKDDPTFHLSKISLKDEKTFEIISEGNTLGIFQLESDGMTSLIKRLKPSTFEDIASCIALFRPGPMDNIPQYLNNRQHPEEINYLHPNLKPILEETYGIIVYQEQIMIIARKLAGFSFAKADILRKAMSKKKLNELASLHDDFIDGCLKNHYAKDLAEKIYELILKFASYGFNKSHSVAYAMVAYQMAYLKANYPLYFYKALLNGVIGSETKTFEYLQEIKRRGIVVLRPDINTSSYIYKIENQAIRMPLNIIKEVGSSTIKTIEENKFNSSTYEDMVVSLVRLSIGKNVITNLIKAGALDDSKLTRNTMLENLDAVMNYAKEFKNVSLLSDDFDVKPAIVNYKENRFKLAKDEHDVFGFYFSINPIDELKQNFGIKTKNLSELRNLRGYQEGFGHIDRLKEHRTKKGDWMAFMDISDGTSTFDLVIMPNIYNSYMSELKNSKYIYFKGVIEKEGSCLVKQLKVYE